MQSIPGAAPVTVSALPIAIWCSDFRGASDDQAAMQLFSPVRGAYVACIRIRGGWSAVSETRRLRCGRTNDFGWVLHRERGDLGEEGDVPRASWRHAGLPPGGAPEHGDVDPEDAGVPRPTSLEMFTEDDPVMAAYDTGDANADALYVLPNESYRIHWSYDRALFDLFLAQYEQDPERAFAEFKVREYVVEPFPTTSDLPYFAELSPGERGWITRQLSTGREGYHAGWPRTSAMSGAIFDGTPHVLRTLLFCEWVSDTCLRMIQNDKDWAHLHTLRGVISASRSGAIIPDLAKKLPSGERATAAHEMRTYLYWLAWAGMRDRGIAQSLVDVAHVHRSTQWKISATGVASNPKFSSFPHPALGATPDADGHLINFMFSAEEQAALVAYFDMYALGLDFEAESKRVEQSWPQVLERSGWVFSNVSKRLSSVSHIAMMRALAVHVPKSSARRDLAERYFRTCAQLDVRFWKHPEVGVATQSFWDGFKPYMVWLAEDAGLLAEVLVTALEPHLRAYRNCTAAELEPVVQYFFRYHLTLSDQPVSRTLPELNARLKLEKIDAGEAVIATLTTRQGTTELARLKLLTRLPAAGEDRVFAPVGRPFEEEHVARFKAARKKATRQFTAVEQTVRIPDVDALQTFPKKLAVFAAVVKTSLVMKALIDANLAADLQIAGEVDAGLFLSLTQETLAAVGPTTDLIAYVRDERQYGGANDWLVRGGNRFVKAGLALEALRGVVAGVTTLATLLPHETRERLGATGTTDLDRYLRDRESFAALVETTKGIVQVGVGAAQLCVLGGATTLAGVALSQVIGVGLVAVALMDVVIYVDTGGSSPVQEFKDGVNLALKRQFSQAPSALGSSKGREHVCMLARRLGALNALAKAS
ncbi:MAG TPA: hypothetical protein VFX59_24065 [Polyangiales bacterium]|nr:hypothetical protein [Polyangiales bacterium]